MSTYIVGCYPPILSAYGLGMVDPNIVLNIVGVDCQVMRYAHVHRLIRPNPAMLCE